MPTTELDDLKLTWKELTRNLERQHALAFHQFKETRLGGFRRGLRPLQVGQIIQLVGGAILAGMSGSFWVRHFGTPHLMIYGLLLHAYGLMLIVFAVRDLVLIHQIDYAAPVIAIQKQMAALRGWHLRAGEWFGIAGSFIWVPLMLMIFYWLGVDLWLRKPPVVYWFIATGFICVAFTCVLVRWSRQPASRFAHSLRDNSAGRSVKRAQAALDEIERFERE